LNANSFVPNRYIKIYIVSPIPFIWRWLELYAERMLELLVDSLLFCFIAFIGAIDDYLVYILDAVFLSDCFYFCFELLANLYI